MGAYDFLMNGAQGVQLPDPVSQAQKFMSLSQIVNANKLSQYTLQAAQRKDAAATGVGQALGGLDINDDAAVSRAIQSASPDARQGIMDAVLNARKTMALAGKDTAAAGKDTAEANKIKYGVAGGLAQALLTKGPNVTQQDVSAANANAQRVGLPGDMFTPPPGSDPASHWQSIAGAATDAAKQLEMQGQAATRAETGRHNVATETQAGAALGETGRHNVQEEAIGRANAGSAAMHARAAMVTADPFGLSGLNTGGGGGGMPSVGPSLPQGVNPADAGLFKAAMADAAKNGQPTFKIGAQGPFNVADYQGGSPTAAAPTGGPGGIQAAMQAGLHGDEFLATLPPQIAGMVKGLAEGRQPFPSGAALRSPQTQQLLSLVSQYDPNFDAVNYAARNKTRSSFAAGNDAATTAALNQLAGHIDRLQQSSAALNNGSLPFVNRIENAVGNQVNPDLQARLGRWNTDVQAVISEAERVFRGTGGSEADLARWRKSFDAADSPEKQAATISELGHLIGSRIDAQVTKYQSGMGTTARSLPQLTPAAAATYNKLGVDVSAETGPAPGGKQSAAPPDKQALLMQARDAISKGADPAKVKARLQQMGVTDTP